MATRPVSNIDLDSQIKILNAPTATASGDVVPKSQLDSEITSAKSRTNHTGTQTWSTISDADTNVRLNRLDQMAPPTNPVSLNNQRATNAGAATADTDLPQWGQVKDLLSGARKTDVRLVTTSNDTLSGLAARDGVTPVAGDRVLVTGNGAANGIYVAASGAWARATDADNASEFATHWLVSVREGTANGGTLWQHDTDAVVTLGTTSLVFTKLGPIASSGGATFNATCPVVSAGGTWTITHNLNTRTVMVQIWETGSPYRQVPIADIRATTVNTVDVVTDRALASGELEARIRVN